MVWAAISLSDPSKLTPNQGFRRRRPPSMRDRFSGAQAQEEDEIHHLHAKQ